MWSRFLRNQRGGVAVMFSLAITTILGAVGAAHDYSQASNTRTALQGALDAAMLMAGRDALEKGSVIRREDFIRLMQANLPPHLQAMAEGIVLKQTDMRLSASLSTIVSNRFASVLGMPTSAIGIDASVPIGGNRLEVALVLDSTGSMADLGKMEALKLSAKNLIDTLVANQPPGSELALSVVPFGTQVRVATSYDSAEWIDFRKGNANPKHDATPIGWDGCIMDRDKPYNKKKDKPTNGKKDEAHPAQNCAVPTLQAILPLTTSTATARAKIDALVPGGNTNTIIGMAWGYNVLTPGNPLSDGAAPASRRPVRALVFLTDGLNTEDRFPQPTAAMDADMRDLCKSAATADIRVFTIRVVEGNDALLKDCASSPGDFYSTSDSAGLLKVFQSIAGKLMRLRLSS
jgi:Flp pilus assembly protein TadG